VEAPDVDANIHQNAVAHPHNGSMGAALIDSFGKLAITPSAGSASTDFDFLVGSWTVHNRKLKSRLCGCADWTEFDFETSTRSVLSGFGNLDESGSTLRMFDPDTRLWTIYGAFPGAVSIDLMFGSFEGSVGSFFGLDSHEGRPVICQFEWDKTDPDAPIWKQALSEDGGASWEWNWTMWFRRVGSVKC